MRKQIGSDCYVKYSIDNIILLERCLGLMVKGEEGEGARQPYNAITKNNRPRFTRSSRIARVARPRLGSR